MNTDHEAGSIGRSLRTIDGIAFGAGLITLSLSFLRPPLMLGLTAVAVFLPSLLREAGWLKDADEFTLGVMRRAGFHGLLAATGIYVLDRILVLAGAYRGSFGQGELFEGETLAKVTVGAFLVSYLIQYRGARLGTFWVLIGAAAMTLGSLAFAAGPGYEPGVLAVAGGGVLVLSLILVALAMLVRTRPRLGAGVLLALFAAVVLLVVSTVRSLHSPVGLTSIILQVGLLFGCTGWALRRETGVDAPGTD